MYRAHIIDGAFFLLSLSVRLLCAARPRGRGPKRGIRAVPCLASAVDWRWVSSGGALCHLNEEGGERSSVKNYDPISTFFIMLQEACHYMKCNYQPVWKDETFLALLYSNVNGKHEAQSCSKEQQTLFLLCSGPGHQKCEAKKAFQLKINCYLFFL